MMVVKLTSELVTNVVRYCDLWKTQVLWKNTYFFYIELTVDS